MDSRTNVPLSFHLTRLERLADVGLYAGKTAVVPSARRLRLVDFSISILGLGFVDINTGVDSKEKWRAYLSAFSLNSSLSTASVD